MVERRHSEDTVSYFQYQELYDYLMSTIQFVFQYAKDHNISLPNPTNLRHSLEHIDKLMDSVNANHLKPINRPYTERKLTADDTEPPRRSW